MPTKIIAIAAALSLGLSGAALAQSSTGKGGTGGTVDPSGPVRNNTGDTGHGMERSTGTMAPGAAAPGTTGSTAPGPGGTMGGGAGSAGGGNSAAGR